MAATIDAIYSLKRRGECWIPLFLSSVAAGFPSPADDYLDECLDLNEHLIQHPSATFLVRARGDSMIGAGIQTGDLLIVDKSLEPSDGDIVIVSVDGQFMVKRLRRNAGRPRLHAENDKFPQVEVSEESSVEIWGVVLHVIHSPRQHGHRPG